MLQRVEKIGEKMTEVFLGRDDHLVYRSVRYGDLPDAMPEGDGRCELLTGTSSSYWHCLIQRLAGCMAKGQCRASMVCGHGEGRLTLPYTGPASCNT